MALKLDMNNSLNHIYNASEQPRERTYNGAVEKGKTESEYIIKSYMGTAFLLQSKDDGSERTLNLKG